MKFTLVHDIDCPLDAVELAVISPDLAERLARALPPIEAIEQVEHTLVDGALRRAWRYRANAPIPAFARGAITKEMLAWVETSDYSLADHASRWSIDPNVKPDWKRFFRADGTYRLTRRPEGRTARTVEGVVEVKVAMVGPIAERIIVAEVRKTFDAEASVLREMATLR